ncbi:DUF2634 domain-containing protein [Paenibacillus sp. NPDC093718]|uniref:DUF2634 domain-containing protein n=1 Tax=Paenibacillus sp. NPDC093718 TaxID=3390601 RepID=UPI003D086D22
MSLPQISQVEFDTITEETTLTNRGKSFLFDFKTGQFVLRNGKMVEANGLEALKIWIEKTLLTAKYRFPIYNGTEYGSSVDDLIGSNLPADFIQEEMKRETLEALLQHEQINDITDLEVILEGSKMVVSFTVDSVFGTSQQEVLF